MDAKATIREGRAVLGIELGSTRIKAVLIDEDNNVIGQGSHQWENRLVDNLWTYAITDVWAGLQACYRDLADNVRAAYGEELTMLAAIGISAMMHGYMAFDRDGEILVPFRTWRNTNTGRAAAELSQLMDFNMPLRWSLSHLYQCILDGESHVERIDYLTTLAGYIHWQLTGRRVLGLGDASGMMPLGADKRGYDPAMVEKFGALVASKGYSWSLPDILPKPLPAGADAGCLTERGAALLDPSGRLQPGVPMCPPEGDAGTGMVATNAVRPGTGNVSVGTSSFSMIVLDHPMSRPYEAIDIVTTPAGDPVAMVHCNNCTGDINAWVGIFRDYNRLMGVEMDDGELFTRLFEVAMQGDADCGGLVSFNYFSGEPVTDTAEGRPMVVRSVTDRFTLANFMRCHLSSAIVALKLGNEVLAGENVTISRLTGHGGFFKTPGVGQSILSAALATPITVMDNAGEGGAWGMALLARYAVANPGCLPLDEYLDSRVFRGAEGVTIAADASAIRGFDIFAANYRRALPLERQAAACKL